MYKIVKRESIVLYLKDNYGILLKITVHDVANLKRIKRANRFFAYIRNTSTPLLPPKNDKLRYACPRVFTGPYAGFFHQGAARPICRIKSQISEE
jgi:hypothetical protein